jgi:hypothetical protein
MMHVLKSAPERGAGPSAKPMVEGSRAQRAWSGRGPSTMLRMALLPVPGRI